MDIGINQQDRQTIADGLALLLADTYTLYLKTHNFHWNVRGPMFQTLHLMFETQYNEIWLAVDLIAERIRTLGEVAPGTYKQLGKLSSIKEEEEIPKATDMVRDLVRGHEQVAKTARAEGFDEIADWFETLAKAEKSHAGRFQKALDTLGK